MGGVIRSSGRWVRSGRIRALATLAAVATIAALLVAAVPAAIASSAFAASADAYVQETKPDSNYGTRTFLRVDNSPARYAFLMFDVSGVGAQSSAELQIFVETTGDGVDVYAVADTTWTETGITFNNAPPLGAWLDGTGNVSGGSWHALDVSAAVTGDGTYAFALVTTDNTAIRISSREGTNPPTLFVPPPPPPANPSPFQVTRSGSTYTAASQTTSESYTGTLKSVVEASATSLQGHGGGTIYFVADTFDLGSDHFELNHIDNIEFAGQGIGATVLTNNSSAAEDTEPFDAVNSDGLTVRDMTISAGGPARSTSDALDFDDGNNVTVERVEIVASRGRGIVFDGKGSGWTSTNNVVRDCIITGIPGDGIEMLAAGNNTVTGCVITDVGGHGIQMTKSSGSAAQPNKKASDNLVSGNTVTNSGRDGVNVNSSDGNTIIDNVITNSSDDTSGRDGVRLESNGGITCDDNVVENNTATDNQSPKTQKYGLNISSSNCNRTVVGANDFAGNLTGEIQDLGTDTQYNLPPDTEAPSVPTGVGATPVSSFQVDISWNASTDNVGVAGYDVYRDGAYLATVGAAALTFRDETAAPETTYGYTVDAFDAAGNTSAQSSPPAMVTTPPAGGPITLVAVADTYVHAGNPTSNYGSAGALRIDGSPDLDAYLKFNVVGVTGTVSSATLRIYAATGSPVGFDAVAVADSSWLESALTYANAPALGATLDSSGSFGGGNYIEVDVTAHVTGNGLVSFALTGTHKTAVRFDSREGTNAPELVIVQS